MRVVKNTEKIVLKVSNTELLQDKYLSLTKLSSKVRDFEIKQNVGYKSFRTKLYNSITSDKYNISEIAGIRFIDTEKPMKKDNASLFLEFQKEDKEVQNENNV